LKAVYDVAALHNEYMKVPVEGPMAGKGARMEKRHVDGLLI